MRNSVGWCRQEQFGFGSGVGGGPGRPGRSSEADVLDAVMKTRGGRAADEETGKARTKGNATERGGV